MKGQELMESLSFVDDELLEEASEPRRTVVPRKTLLAAAACVVLMLGAAAVVQRQSIPGAGNTEGVSGAQTEAAATEAAPVQGSTLVVRVEAFSEDGFTASVVESGENTGFAAGELLEIRFDGAEYDRAENHKITEREELWYRVTVDRIENGIVYVTEAVELPESERRN